MSRFDFTHNALDVALRRLLMHMSLPRETQQIDRIIEAFAVRYEECEPGLFIQKGVSSILGRELPLILQAIPMSSPSR
jgi:Sec7-like guanine-nucleotide exchange factor